MRQQVGKLDKTSIATLVTGASFWTTLDKKVNIMRPLSSQAAVFCPHDWFLIHNISDKASEHLRR